MNEQPVIADEYGAFVQWVDGWAVLGPCDLATARALAAELEAEGGHTHVVSWAQALTMGTPRRIRGRPDVP